jgi:hypothetical protein
MEDWEGKDEDEDESLEFPELTLDSKDDSDKDNDKLEEGNHILYTVLVPPEDIHARSTESQQLAEAFTWNSVPPRTDIPE